MEKKIVCAICKNEENKRCIVKKVSVAINKKRRCDKFIFEPTKVKEKQILKTIKLPYKEKEELRQRYKKELKNYRQSVKDSIINKPHPTTAANPVTGDLSRFISTAGNKKNNG
jgi:hypoxanthine phosphoribosyltransferase